MRKKKTLCVILMIILLAFIPCISNAKEIVSLKENNNLQDVKLNLENGIKEKFKFLIGEVEENEDFNSSLIALKDTVNPGEEFEARFKVSELEKVENGLITISGQLEYDKEVLEIIEIIEDDESWNKTIINDASLKFVTDSEKYITEESTVFKIKFKVKENISDLTTTNIIIKNIIASNGDKDILSEDAKSELNIESTKFKTSLTSIKQKVNPKQEFEINFDISNLENIENGLVAISGQLEYDKQLLEIIAITENTEKWNPSLVNEESFKFVTDAEGFVTEDGTVFKIKFKVKDNILEPVETSIFLKNVIASNGYKDILSNDAELKINIEIPEEIFITSSKYEVEENMISKITPNTNVANFIANIETNRDAKILDKNGNELQENAVVGTGMILKIGDELEYPIVVTGDIDGNGEITATDLAKIKLHCIRSEILEGVELKASDLDRNNQITVTDIAKMKAIIVGLMEVE